MFFHAESNIDPHFFLSVGDILVFVAEETFASLFQVLQLFVCRKPFKLLAL